MAVIRYPISEDDASLGITGKCSICQRNAKAYWCGSGMVFEVCGSCAREKLPLLIAESMDEQSLCDSTQIETIKQSMFAAFWRGIALRLIHRKKDESKSRRKLVEAN